MDTTKETTEDLIEAEEGASRDPARESSTEDSARGDADDTVVSLSPIDIAAEIAAAEAAEARLRAVEESSAPQADGMKAPERSRASMETGSAIFILLAAGMCIAFSAIVHAVASGRLPAGADPGLVAAACQLLYGLCLLWLFARKERDDRHERDSRIALALSFLARGSTDGLTPSDPLAPAFEEARDAIEAAARERLDALDASVRKESHVELVRVKSQCERLVEKYAEKIHREKKDTEALLEEMKGRHEEERKTWRAEAQTEAKQLADAKACTARAEERAAQLSGELSEKGAECERLSRELDRLLEEVNKLRQQNVRFFDKVAAQLRGSLQIAGKLASDLCSKSGSGGSRTAAPVGPDGRTLDECAQEIRGRIHKTERLVDQIVDLCRVETSTMSLVYSESDVAALMKECLSEVREVAAGKNIDLTLKSPKTLPGVITDARLLVRITRELVSNAVRYTPRGGRVSLTLNVAPQHPFLVHARDPSTEWLRVDVTDTGEGIRPEDRDRIFAAFERGTDPQYTMSDASPGLGLTLAKHYAKLIGGDILLDTAPGKGSTFSLLLPVKVCVVTHIA